MRGVRGFPYADWPRLTRREASLSTQLAWAWAPASARAALLELRAVLGAAPALGPLSTRVVTRSELTAIAGADLAVLLGSAPGVAPVVLSLPPHLARVVGDRALGGTGEDVAPGPLALSGAEAGLVAYVLARALHALERGTYGVLDALPLSEALPRLPDESAIAWSAEVTLGRARAHATLLVPLSTIATVRPPTGPLPEVSVRGYLDVGVARLSSVTLGTMQVDDTLVPDALWLDPRRGPSGHARLRLSRSARTFELTSSDGERWVVTHASPLAAPHPPARPRRPTMTESPSTLPALADVEVELAIELARIELPIAEVAALAPGVVLTTGRLLGERVAIRAGERVLAWGELVDVEGEIGVRITDVG